MIRNFKADVSTMTCTIDGVVCKMQNAYYTKDRAKNNGQNFWVNLKPLNIDKKWLTVHKTELEGTFDDTKTNNGGSTMRLTLANFAEHLNTDYERALFKELKTIATENYEKSIASKRVDTKKAKLLAELAKLGVDISKI